MTTATPFKVYNASAGSGKTFTLVKEYLNILLTSESEYVFQEILAITFTNKAAAEMKERILKNLRSFSDGESSDMLDLIANENKLSLDAIQFKASRILSNILQNYAAFNITTIDSFTHKLIRSFAYDLELPLNFDVEMDGSKLISEAVDVLISKIGVHKELTNILVAFSLQKVEDDKAWDISKELNSIASILLNETDANYLDTLHSKSITDFKKIEIQLKKKKLEIENLFEEYGNKGLQLLKNNGLEHTNFSYQDLPKHFIKFTKLSKINYDKFTFGTRLRKQIESGVFCSKATSKEIQQRVAEIQPDIESIYREGEDLFATYHGNYLLLEMVLRDIIPLAVLNHVQKELNEIKEHNSICLSAEFNSIISNKIKHEPAPFIFERVGERFKHFFIDEMQDTSILQWQNLIPLINNALSQEGGSLMLVGDAKQAIYRWRGGKAEQFIDLSLEMEDGASENPFFVKKQLKSLDTNHRSYSEVVNFNNSFFSHIASFLSDSVYQKLYETGNKQEVNSNIGGYVQIDFIDKTDMSKDEKELSYSEKVLEIITSLDRKFSRSDVCIIVRTKKDGITIANYLTENSISIVSSETLLLQNSAKVQFIVHLLTYIQNTLDLNSKFNVLNYMTGFLEINTSEHQFYAEFLALEPLEFFQSFQKHNIFFDYELFLKMPFYESVEYIIRSFKLLKSTDAYVQFFMDFVQEFQRTNHHDLMAFLVTWNQKKDVLSITSSENENAVSIMTIHKSKGLEFPVVIFPSDRSVNTELNPSVWYDNLESSVFGDLSVSRVSCAKKISYTGEKGSSLFEERQSELFLDNFNLLYVALTRSVEQLFVITEYKLVKKTGLEDVTFFSGLFINYLKSLTTENIWDSSKLSYSFGEKRKLLHQEIKEEKEGFEFQQNFISSPWESHQIEIVSNSSIHWGEEHEFAVSYGLLIHEILSKIIVENDVNIALESYLSSGLVLKKDFLAIKGKIEKIVSHKRLNSFFKGGYEVYTEREIIDENKKIMIPDRLMIKGNKAYIVDYKTGKESVKHRIQIENYQRALEKMNFDVVENLLVYLDNEKVINIV